MNIAQRVFFNTGIQVVARAVGLLVSLLVLRLTTNYLGVEQFGQLAIILGFVDLLRVVSDFGVGTTLAREIAKNPSAANELGGNFLVIRLVTSTSAVLIALAVLPVLPYDQQTKTGLAVALAGLFFMSLASFPNAFFQTNLRLDLQAGLDIATKLLNLAGILCVRALDLGFYGVVVSFVIINCVIFVLAFGFSRRFWRINLGVEWHRARVLMRDSVGIGFVSMIGLLHFRGDAILLSLLKPATDVGIYSIAFRFIDQAFFLPGVFIAALFPVMTRAIHRGQRDAEVTINHAFRALLLGAVAVSVLIIIAAPVLVRLVSSSEFDNAIEPLRILAFAIPAVFVSPVFYNAVVAVNKQRDLIVIGLASLVFNVLLNLVLIPRYSYNGAAISTVVTEGFSCIASFAVAKRWIEFQVDRAFMLRAFLATAAAGGAAALAWRASPWLTLVVAEAAFLVSAYAVGAITRSDMRVLLQRTSVT